MESNGRRLELPVEAMVWHLLMSKGEQPLPRLSPAQLCCLKTGAARAVGSRPTLPLPHPSAWFCACRAPRSNPDEGSLLYTLPDDSAHQLLQPRQACHRLQERPAATGQPGMRRVPQGPGLEAMWDPLFHPGQC